MLNYFTHLSFGETFKRIFHIFQTRWVGFIAIALLVYVAGWICSLLLSLMLGGDLRIDGFSVNYSYILALDSWEKKFFYVIESLVYYIFCCIAHGAGIWLVVYIYLNQTPTITDAFKKAWEKSIPLVGATILVLLITAVPTMPLFIFVYRQPDYRWYELMVFIQAVYVIAVSVVTYLVYPTIMVEEKGPWRSIKRSWDLTEGHRLHVLAIIIVWGCFKALLSFVVMTVARQGPNVYYVTKTLDTVFGILLLSIIPVFEGVIYTSIRVAKEELNCDILGAEVGIDGDKYVDMVSTAPESEQVETQPNQQDVKAGATNEAGTLV